MLALVLAATACSSGAERRTVEGEIEQRTIGTFYDVSTPAPAGDPGQILRSEDLLGAPDGTRAWRVVYSSRDADDQPIAVSAVIVAPNDGRADSDRPIVSWGHPTTGTAPKCAPSVGVDPFSTMEGVHELLDAGYVVVATDYSGMGVDGPPSYLIGTTEGRNVLDAARAARAIPDTGAGDRLLLWGHSQGGQAALFAAQDAPTYAPELRLEAVAVAAPAVELGELLNDDIGDGSGVALGSYAFEAYQQAYGATTPGLELSQILTPAGVTATPQMADLCLFGEHDQLHAVADPLVGKYLSANPADVAPWSALLQQNTPGATPVNVPMFVAQGDDDQLVRPQTTKDFVTRLCAAGEQVHFRTFERTTHALIAEEAIPYVLTTFKDALDGKPPTVTC